LAALLPRLALIAALLAALTWLLIGLARLSAGLLATLVWIVCLVHCLLVGLPRNAQRPDVRGVPPVLRPELCQITHIEPVEGI
jgi:hypothetical protein